MATTLPVLLSSLLYAVVGIVVFVIGFYIFDLLTPGSLWDDIRNKQNLAVSHFAGAIAIGFAIIVAAAIHG